MFKNESVKAVVLTALGVTVGIILYIGGQMAYDYAKTKMAEKKDEKPAGSASAADASAAGTSAQEPAALSRVA